MVNIALGIFLIYCLLALIGLGPSLLIFSENTANRALSLSPAIGLVLTTLIGTYLVLLDIPALSWGIIWPCAAIGLSLIMTFSRIKYASPLNINKKELWIFLAGLFLTLLLINLPMLLGHLNFTILRGNGTDDFNYITTAGYLLHEPYSWAASTPLQTLIDKHPSYDLARQLLTERWSTSMLMAWSSAVTHLPLYQLEYGFTTLFFIITFSCAFEFALLLELKIGYALLVALAIVVGFWGQFVLDIRAMSQISALPLLVFLACLLASIESSNNKNRLLIFLGLVCTAIIFLYTEIVFLLALGIFIFTLIQLLTKKNKLSTIVNNYCLILSVILISGFPAATHLSHFFEKQTGLALFHKNNWDSAYFHWLYKSLPLLGFWGLADFDVKGLISSPAISLGLLIALVLLSILLTLLLLYALYYLTLKIKNINLNNALLLSLAFFSAAFIGFLYLILRQQYWAAGKVLSYGYPFIYFLVAVIGLKLTSLLTPNLKFQLLGKMTVMLWLILQCSFGVYRIFFAVEGKGYPNYISQHGEYRQHDWDISNLIEQIQARHIKEVGILLANDWTTEYFDLAIGWEAQIINLSGIKDRNGLIIAQQRHKERPKYIITSYKNISLPRHTKILAHNTEFVLIQNQI